MRSLDMTPYRPYRAMGRSCLTRPIKDKQVLWVRPEVRTSTDGHFVARPLQTAEIAAAAEFWRHAYPEVYGTDHEFILFPEDYSSHFILADSWEQDCRVKKCCMLVAGGSRHRQIGRRHHHDQVRQEFAD